VEFWVETILYSLSISSSGSFFALEILSGLPILVLSISLIPLCFPNVGIPHLLLKTAKTSQVPEMGCCFQSIEMLICCSRLANKPGSIKV
jgi:hypothetical protein